MTGSSRVDRSDSTLRWEELATFAIARPWRGVEEDALTILWAGPRVRSLGLPRLLRRELLAFGGDLAA